MTDNQFYIDKLRARIEQLEASNAQRGNDLATVIAQRDAAEQALRGFAQQGMKPAAYLHECYDQEPQLSFGLSVNDDWSSIPLYRAALDQSSPPAIAPCDDAEFGMKP